MSKLSEPSPVLLLGEDGDGRNLVNVGGTVTLLLRGYILLFHQKGPHVTRLDG